MRSKITTEIPRSSQKEILTRGGYLKVFSIKHFLWKKKVFLGL
jgi:hypothetical protein